MVMVLQRSMASLRDHWARIRSDKFLLAWNISLVVTMVLPVIVFGVARAGMSQGGENRNQGQQEGNENEDSYAWWQFWKSNNNNGDQHGNRGEEDGSPWWCKSYGPPQKI